VFTTRPDTLWGATFMVVAPEHKLLARVPASHAQAVRDYVALAAFKSELERTDLAKDKSGVFTGLYAHNPVFDAGDPRGRVPIWVADYVLAATAPARSCRSPATTSATSRSRASSTCRCARSFVRRRASRVSPTARASPARARRSTRVPIDGLPTRVAQQKAIELLAQRGLGKGKVTYKLRDWLFSRQRYWGEPFPLVHLEDGRVVAVADEELPVELPAMDDFKPASDGSAPLARAREWLAARDPASGRAARRDTDTMPGWAGSCWYWLRFMDPQNASAPYSREAEGYWGPVDLYVGGAAHAVLHLLYARFWHKVLFDLGLVHTKEPFQRLFNQGMITAFAYQDASGRLVPSDEIVAPGDGFAVAGSGAPATQIVTKMAKSLKNVVNPDDIIAEAGADTLRLYEMFMGPLGGLEAVEPARHRRLPALPRARVADVRRSRHAGRAAARAARRPAARRARGSDARARAALQPRARQGRRLVQAPELQHGAGGADELRQRVLEAPGRAFARPGRALRARARALRAAPVRGAVVAPGPRGLARARGVADRRRALPRGRDGRDPVQVLGKLRGKVVVARGAGESAIVDAARAAVPSWLEGKTVVKTVVVPGKLVNFVVR
jgi:leucyl-tRNA synthetase